MAANELKGDTVEEPSGPSHPGSEEPHCRWSTRLRSKIRHVNREDCHAKRHPHSSKSLKGKRSFQKESEIDEEVLSTHKRHDCHPRIRNSRTGSDKSVNSHWKNRPTSEKDLPVLRPVDGRLRKELDYVTNHPNDTSSRYDVETTENDVQRAKHLQLQMTWQIFDLFDTNYVISFLSAFKLASITNRVQKGAVHCLPRF